MSKQLVLIAGYGSVGRRHVRNLQSLGCSKLMFFRTRRGTIPDEALANDVAGCPQAYELEAVWPHRPQIAVISNPSSSHIEVAIAAARNGCDLFIEKPLSDSLEHCEELAEVVRQKNLVAMIGCQFRFHPLLVRLREGISAGVLGSIAGARAEWGEYLPDWHPWEDHRRSYSARSDMGGGVVLTLIHPLDYLYWLFGQADRVHASTRAIPSLQTPAGEDWAEITIDFRSGVVGQVHLDYLQRPAVHRLTVWGDRGRAEWDCHAGTLRWETIAAADQKDSSAPNAGPTVAVEHVPAGFERNTMFLDEMRHFLQCVESRQTPAVPLADGIAVLEIALAAKQSAREAARHA
jgi:predicted dehydrogenase